MSRKEISQANPEVSGNQHIKYHHHTMSEIIQGVGPFHNLQWIKSECYLGLEKIHRNIKEIL